MCEGQVVSRQQELDVCVKDRWYYQGSKSWMYV